MAIWSKVPDASLRNQHAGREMANYLALLNGGTPQPEILALAVTTSSLEPMCFLTCRETSSTAVPTIELIHSIGNYVVVLGQVDDLHGHSFAFVGETTGDQLPSSLLEPTAGVATTVTRRNVPVPDLATVQGHYAQAGASVLMPSGTGGPNADVASVCMIPLMWAPYFIEGGTPKATLDKIEQLVAASAVEHRPSFSFIQDWGRFVCLAQGPQAPQSHRPSAAVAWKDFPRDRQYTEWATQRFKAVYNIVPPTRGAPPAAGGGAASHSASIAAAIVAGLQGASQAERDKKEKYANHEKLSILAACGLHLGDWNQAPPIYDKISQDGRTLSAVRVALETEYRETVLTSEIPASVFFSTQLVSDIKDTKFGWQESQAYATCHRGISPFNLPHTSIESHQALRALEEDAAMATSTTISDMKAARTGPPPCPTDYYGLLQLMCSYMKLLMMLFGANCDHLIQVSTIYFLIKERVSMFQLMSKEQVAHLLWSVFIDARTYFSTPHDLMGNPPASRLDWLVSAMRGGALPPTMGTPLLSMFGNSRDGPRNPLLGAGAGTQNGGTQNGGPPYTNSQVNAKIAEATVEAMRCASTVNFRTVSATAAAPKPQLGSLSLSRGGCFDFLFFGKCTAARCTYKHDGQINEAKIDGVISKMRPALAQFVSANSNS
jgi:hypothetical protein